ncbi:hypothetical protein IH992_28995 [Candidatus Poribacteria bacterium]|nr:hypothetical protein [Candidatus Poribacteria bacterium]
MSQLHRLENMCINATHRFTQLSRDSRGSTILFVLSLIAVFVLLGGAITQRTIFELRDANHVLQRNQAFYLAEAGIQRALYEQRAGEFGATLDTGSYSVQVTNWGSDGVDNDNDGDTDEIDEAVFYGVTSTGTAGSTTREVHAVMTGQVAT